MPFYPPQPGPWYAAPRPMNADPKLLAAAEAIAASPGVFTPGPAAPSGVYVSTSSSGRPPSAMAGPAGGGSITENEQPGWLVAPGQYVALNVRSILTVEAVANGWFVPAPTGAQDNTSPAHAVNGQAGLNVFTKANP